MPPAPQRRVPFTVTGQCEAPTMAGPRCLRDATHLTPQLAVWPRRRLCVCSTHFGVLVRLDRHEGPAAAQSLIASWSVE